MPKDRDQQTPDDAEDRERLARTRGQGTGGTGLDLLPGEAGDRRERMELDADDFDDGDVMPARYAHDQDNLSPALTWGLVPRDAAELVLLCLDPDAPGGTFIHWVLTGIDPSSTGIEEGTVPAGAVGHGNDFGEVGWSGPEPPVGDDAHRYVFTLFASAVPLGLDPGATLDDVLDELSGNVLARGELVGLYRR